MIKMLVLDIDGTILSAKTPITTKLIKYIKILKQNGIKVVIATGRMHKSAKVIAAELGTDDPIISYQGGMVIDKSNNILDNRILDENLAREVIEYFRKEKIHTNIYINDELIVEQESKEIIDYIEGKYVKYTKVETFDGLDFSGLNKVLAINYNPDLIKKQVNVLQQRYKNKLYIVRSTPYFCEVANPTATKGNGIRFLAKLWNIKQEEIMAIGDQDNDIEMLLAAGKRIAMGNATEELKKVSNYITKTVDEHGVICAIEKFIDLKKFREDGKHGF